MSEESTEALAGSGGEVLPQNEAKPPRNDAEAAQAEAAKETPKEEAPSPGKEEQERKRNRTSEYIQRLQKESSTARSEAAELKQRLEALESRLPKPEPIKAPSPEEYYADPAGYAERQAQYAVEQARQKWIAEQEQAVKQQSAQQVWQTYNERALQFASDNPDFHEVAGSIRFPLSPEIQAAIASHESGPAIAYHLGLNEQDAFQLASVQPHLAAYVLEQIASRLKEAPQPAIAATPSPPAALAEATKPISQAPAPAPRVGGRSPTEVPPEKLTDDEWYRQDRERRRKR